MIEQPWVRPVGLSGYAVSVPSATALRYESMYAPVIVLMLAAPGSSLKSRAMTRGSPNPWAQLTSSEACTARTEPPHGEHSRVTIRWTIVPLTSRSTSPAVLGPVSIDAGCEYELS